MEECKKCILYEDGTCPIEEGISSIFKDGVCTAFEEIKENK